MADLLRGQIRWADLETANQVIGHEQGNSRPVLILSNDKSNALTQLVIAALITSTPPTTGNQFSLSIQTVQMPRDSWVLSNQIRTLSAGRIGDLIGKVSDEELTRVQRAIFRLFSPS